MWALILVCGALNCGGEPTATTDLLFKTKEACNIAANRITKTQHPLQKYKPVCLEIK